MAWRLWSLGRSPTHAIVSSLTSSDPALILSSSPSSSSSCFSSDIESESEKSYVAENNIASTGIEEKHEIRSIDDKRPEQRRHRLHSHSSCRSSSRRSQSRSESASEAAAEHQQRHCRSHRRKSSHNHSPPETEPHDSTPTAVSRISTHEGNMIGGSSPGMARRPSLASKRTHSNTSVGRIMVDLLPEKLDVPKYSTLCARRVPSVSALSETGRSASTALTTSSSDGTSSQIF